MGGIAAGVFLKAYGWGFQESPVLHLGPLQKYPKFCPKTPKYG